MGYIKYNFNINYFEQIDTQDKAYFLGLLYADGTNYNNRISKYVAIDLQERDENILLKFINFIEGDCKLHFIDKSKNPKHQNMKRLQINGAKFSNDLVKLGCIQNKTSTIEFPSIEILPKHLQSHFIRGYFDGDGCIWDGKRKKMIVKDKAYKSGFRERIIHNVKFNFAGNEKFLKQLQNILISDLLLSNVKINLKKNSIFGQLEYSGRNSCKKLYEYFYKNSIVHLDRKKEKFESILCANI